MALSDDSDVIYYTIRRHWRPELVLLSFIVSLLGAYTTTQLCIQTGGTRQTGRAVFWILLASISFGGTGIWCMHFIGMLAVDLGIPVQYDTGQTVFTAGLAVCGMFFTLMLNIVPPERSTASTLSLVWHFYIDTLSKNFWIRFWNRRVRNRITLSYDSLESQHDSYRDDSELSQQLEDRSSTVDSDSMYREFDLREVRPAPGSRSTSHLHTFKDVVAALWTNCTPRILISGALLGMSVFSMHYLGMKAMSFQGRMRYNLFFVLLSYLEAWFTSVVALIYMPTETDTRRQLIFSLVAGVAVSGLHYIGMFATTFETTLMPPHIDRSVNYTLAASCAGIAITTCFISYAFLAHAVSDHRTRLQGYIQTRKELWKANAERRAFERSNRLKSDFIATASHELRTPLYSISGYSELLQTTNLDQEQAAYVNLIKSATKALSLITDSVLDFSKLENDNVESQAKPTKVEIKKLVADCVRQCYMRKDHRSEDVTLFCIIDDNVPEVCWVDEVYLARVIFNLCGNALKFTSEGFVYVRLTLGDNPMDLILQCIDTGIGIPAKSLQDIFKPFRQVDSTLQRKFHGTGLGLAISLSLMEKLGGTIAVNSSQDEDDPERGTCFTCMFPHVRPPGENAATEETVSSVVDQKIRTDDSIVVRNALTVIQRHPKPLPALDNALSERFNLHTIGLNNLTRKSSSNRRILTEIECFKNEEFQILFNSHDQERTWFVCFDEDAAAMLDVNVENLLSRPNVILLRRPICIDKDFFNQLDSLQATRSFESDDVVNERVNPILPVTRDRARDKRSSSKVRQVKFSIPNEGFQSTQPSDQILDEVDSAPISETTQSQADPELLSPVKKQSQDQEEERCILLVEDNKINSKLGLTLLKKCGLKAMAAENGQEAIDLIFNKPRGTFALILMDCQMPVMDGFTATRKIRAWEKNKGNGERLPIIALTANVSEAAEKECLEAGADKFLPKPLTMKNLRDEISQRI